MYWIVGCPPGGSAGTSFCSGTEISISRLAIGVSSCFAATIIARYRRYQPGIFSHFRPAEARASLRQLATQLRKRGVDPGAVHRTPRLQIRQCLVFSLVLRRRRLIHLLDLAEGNAKQAVAI